jgi:hypothetical protein
MLHLTAFRPMNLAEASVVASRVEIDNNAAKRSAVNRSVNH